MAAAHSVALTFSVKGVHEQVTDSKRGLSVLEKLMRVGTSLWDQGYTGTRIPQPKMGYKSSPTEHQRSPGSERHTLGRNEEARWLESCCHQLPKHPDAGPTGEECSRFPREKQMPQYLIQDCGAGGNFGALTFKFHLTKSLGLLGRVQHGW